MPDVNVLVYAHRAESPDHLRYAQWLTDLASGSEPFGLSDLVCSAFLRIVTIPSLWTPPTELPAGAAFLRNLRARSTCRPLRPGPESWDIFLRLCEQADARGKLVADAYHAALAIEHGCELVTADADFARFRGLRWRHPLQAAR
jgi:toxin-antitoxin system PIN domain toxin